MKTLLLCTIFVLSVVCSILVFDARIPRIYSDLSLKESYEITSLKLKKEGFRKIEYSDREEWVKDRVLGVLIVTIYRYSRADSDRCQSIAVGYRGVVNRKRYINK